MKTIQSTKDAKDELEQLIDTHGLPSVVQMLSAVAYEKAEHITLTWQDNTLSTAWRRAGGRLNTLAGALRSKTMVYVHD